MVTDGPEAPHLRREEREAPERRLDAESRTDVNPLQPAEGSSAFPSNRSA
jgi:hypothetical protein